MLIREDNYTDVKLSHQVVLKEKGPLHRVEWSAPESEIDW